MDLRHIRYLLAVAECRSITKAAEKVRIAQPALSRQLRLLEEELGVALVDRSASGTVLTSVGTVFVDRMRHVLADIDGAVSDIRALSATAPLEIRIALPPMESQYFGLDFIDHMAAGDPPALIRITETWTGTISELLLANTVDVGIVSDSQVAGFAIKTEVWTGKLFLLSKRKDGDSTSDSPIAVGELTGVDLVLPAHGNGTRPVIDEAFRAAGVTPKIKFETASWTMVKEIVESGRASAIVTDRDAINLINFTKVSLRLFVEPEIQTTLFLVGNDTMASSTRVPIFHRMADEIRRTLGQTSGP